MSMVPSRGFEVQTEHPVAYEPERRAHPREPMFGQFIATVEGGPGVTAAPRIMAMQVFNISPGGFGAVSPAPLPEGTSLRVMSPQGELRGGEVVRNRVVEGRYELGVAFREATAAA